MTKAQAALKHYYEAVLALEATGVIGDHHADELSAEMMEAAGDWEDYQG